jgi:predicted alpha/beta superfamily hydrolase
LWWNNESLLKEAPELLKNLPATPMEVYIAVGKEGKMMEGDAKKLAAAVKKAGKPNVKLHFDYLPTKDHGTILHQAAANGFEWMKND